MAASGGSLFVPVVNQPVEWLSQTQNTEPDGGDGEMVALDATTGTVRWISKLPSPVFGSATAVNDLVFTTTYEGKLYALDAGSGHVAWRAQLPALSIGGVAVAGNTVLAAAGTTSGSNDHPELVAYRLQPSGA